MKSDCVKVARAAWFAWGPRSLAIVWFVAISSNVMAQSTSPSARTTSEDKLERATSSQSEIDGSSETGAAISAASPMLGVAVVNLDRVAEALNRIESVQRRMEAKKEELVSRLQLLNEGYQSEIAELVSKYGDEPTAEQKQAVAKRQQEILKSVDEAMKQGRNEFTQFEQKLRQEFQDEVRPVAYQIAADAGFPVVLTSSQVFAYRVGSPQDITERVIKHMRVQSPSQPNAALPELSQPSTKRR